MSKIVIIGGVACGPKAAARIKRLDPSAEVIIIEKGDTVSYGACGLPFYLADEFEDISELTKTAVGVIRDINFFKAVKGVDVKINCEVVEIDRKAKKVKVKNIVSGEEEEISYDKLVIATGSSPVRPPIPGIDLKGIYVLKDLHDGTTIKKAIKESKDKKAVIVGAGMIGMECIEPFLNAGFEVSIVEKLPFVLPTFLDEEISLLIMKHLASKGVKLFCGQGVKEFVEDAEGRVSKVVTEKTEIETSLVVLAIGFRPNVELAKKAGLKIGRFGISVDSFLRTSDPDIYAGGDCVEAYNMVTGEKFYAPMGSTANKHGRVIADNIVGRNTRFEGVTGTGIVKILGLNVARTGITEAYAKQKGYDVITCINPGPDRPHFIKESKPIIIKLIAESYSGRILGMQAIGEGDVFSRVDTAAALIAKGSTIDDVMSVDMAYSPPYSPAMDNLIVAANIVQNKRDGLSRSYNPIELKKKLDAKEDFIILDVRTPQEVEQMRLPYENVVYIPLSKLRERADELPRDKEIVCTCKISLRGYEAVRILVGKGFDREKLAFLDGGVSAWPYEKIVK